jgi:hypothetical protein
MMSCAIALDWRPVSCEDELFNRVHRILLFFFKYPFNSRFYSASKKADAVV